jgi:hypothetical protein
VTDTAHVLQAGGLVATDAKLGKDQAVDVVVARAYRHAVLPGRTIVRLTAQSVVVGDDLEMTTLGFGAGEDLGSVGKERRRPLGFPGWALVHDPKNARFALDVVKEFKKQARKAKSKPGHAKEGIDKIAITLGKSVPHFLPSFYEEAGRAFIEHGSQSYAAAMFGKAREAEAVHALDVDEQHRVDAFLEFALAGAVTTKALTEYAKDLSEHHAPKDAYAHFRQLCLQRTLGGMPPWAGMAKDLHRLVKAAKLDADSEDAKLVEEIIESPALAKASTEFWRAYAEPITALAKAKPAARAALLNLFPTGTTHNEELDEVWLDLLEASGAVDALVVDDPLVVPSGGRAAWFDKLTQHLSRNWRDASISSRAFALLRRIAPVLIKEGAVITCCGRWNALDLDLAELALELGVTVTLPDAPRLDLAAWATHAGDPDHGRDPVRAVAHARIGLLLGESVGASIGAEPFDTRSRGKRGFLAAKRVWLATQLATAERGGLVAFEAFLKLVSDQVNSETFGELPDLYARFVALHLAPALARSLRIGIVDEFGWPALEAAALELDPSTVHGGRPAIVVASATRVIAVDADRRLGEHDLVLPKKAELATARFIGGQFLITIKEGYKLRGYWSSAPHDLFDVEGSVWNIVAFAARAVVLAGGAWQEGKQPIRVGDRVGPAPGLQSFDGTTAWVHEWKDSRTLLREVSASGELGRTSWPAFLEAGAVDDWSINGNESFVLPAGPHDVLGTRDGLCGMRVRTKGPVNAYTAYELASIDGRTWTKLPGALAANRLVRLPTGETRPVYENSQWRGGVYTQIFDDTGLVSSSILNPTDRRYFRGSPTVMPATLWSAFTPRDLEGSKWLRNVSDDDARGLMAAGTRLKDDEPDVQLELPAISNERLRKGIGGFAAIAIHAQRRLDKLVAERAPGAGKPTAASTIGDNVLLAALGGWVERKWAASPSAFVQVARVAAWFAHDDRSDRTLADDSVNSQLDWLRLALVPNALGFLAVARGGNAKVIAAFLSALTTLPDPSTLRFFDAQRVASTVTPANAALELVWQQGNAFALTRHSWGASYHVLQYAPGGKFVTLNGFNTGRPEAGFTAVTELAAIEAAVASGQTSWSDGAPAELASATGLTLSEATYLWAGMPNAHESGANFLDKTLRESLDLKATQAALARDLLNAIPLAKRLAAIAEVGIGVLAPDGVTRLAAAWVKHVGKRLAIPEELIADADREISAPLEPSVALAMISNAEDAPRLTTDGVWGLEPGTTIIQVGSASPLVQPKVESTREVFDVPTLATVLAYLPFIYAELPVGAPLRAQAAIAFDLAQQRLKNPTLLFGLGNDMTLDPAGVAALETAIGGDPILGLSDGHSGRDGGAALVLRQDWTSTGTPPKPYTRTWLHVRPARWDAKAEAQLSTFAKLYAGYGWSPQLCLQLVRSPDIAAIVARIRETPVADGGWEQNPLLSTKKLVTKAAKHLEVSADAAALYLQYLVLLWPTVKNLVLWNGWKPKQLEAATQVLLDAELLLEAKRERAQRTYFLPGGWEALKSPHPPFESWKLPFYGTRAPGGGQAVPTAQRFIAMAPFHLLFERAWQRIESGDIPKYDEVKR